MPVVRSLRPAALAAAVLAAAASASCGLPGPGAPLDPASASPPASTAGARHVVGTVVRFTSPRTSVDVTIGQDSPASRDLLSMLPLTLPVQDLAGREKISYLPRELQHAGTPGSDPEDGDLIYFTPWGNLGFYYDASGIGYSDDTLHLGTYEAAIEQLEVLEGEAVRVEVVR
ncbi:hypothetical protein GTR00_06375 [Kineococcus sp. T90]|nr:hypothetical protein [Kineococcus indalonis]